MIGPIRRLLSEAGRAKQAGAFWQASAEVLSDWAGGAHVRLVYKGLSESGTAEAGSAAQAGESCIADYHDAEGHHVQATFRGLPEGVPTEPLRSGVEIATHLAVMVARRATLERERRLGTFLVELSRWLLAAPERDLLLRYTLQSVVSLVEAQGAFVALRQPDGDTLRIAATVGQCVELDGADIGLTTRDRKSTRLNSSHSQISYAVFCLKKKKKKIVVLTITLLVCLVASFFFF